MAKTKTQQEKVIEYLTKKGFVELKSRSGKYRRFSSSHEGQYYFIGRKGAVRVGRCASNSFSITERIKALIAKENKEKENV